MTASRSSDSLDRLRKVDVDAQVAAAGRVARQVGRSQHHDRSAGSSASALILSTSAKPSISGMWASSQNEGEWSPRLRRACAALRAPPRRRRRRSAASAICASISCRMRRLVALSSTTSTGRPCSESGASLDRRRRGMLGQAEAGGEVERAAPARLRSRPRSARPSVRPAGGDGQAEAGAAVPARRGAVGLGEGLEDRRCFSSGMPMPVSLTAKCRPRRSSVDVTRSLRLRPRPRRGR